MTYKALSKQMNTAVPAHPDRNEIEIVNDCISVAIDYHVSNSLLQLPEGHLATIFYKLTNNSIPTYDSKQQLVYLIMRYLKGANDQLVGKTLPADYHHIDVIKPVKFSDFPHI
jgi:hypothetical protein